VNAAPLLLRVTSVRSQRPGAYGGAIFAGSRIDQAGEVLDAGTYIVVRATARVLSLAAPQPGQWWEVEGKRCERRLEINGYEMLEEQIEASRAMLVRPSGEHVVTLMACNPDFEGIGRVKARRLWERFGGRLYEILDNGDAAALGEVLTSECSEKAIKAWALYGDSDTLKWLQSLGFDVSLGRKLMDFFGPETADMVREDPYRLLSFCATWRQVDEIARNTFGIANDDPRRLNAAVEEACYRVFTAGHTVTSASALAHTLAPILGNGRLFRDLITQALDRGQTNGSYIVAGNGVQPLGAAAMESVVAQAIAARLALGAHAELLSEEAAERLLSQYESEEQFVLNREQRLAVHLARKHAFACITGGAGVGKTTVLKAIYRIFDAAGVHVIQVALAGRAAKRMHEATGRAASTIANFLRTVRADSLTGPIAVVVDEASMVDIIAMSQICELLPAHVRLILVGDPNQLMPVGPGLVLHSVVSVEAVPGIELTTVKRYGDEIRDAAGMIREGKWPTLNDDRATDVAFFRCRAEEVAIASAVLRLYIVDPANTQILCSHRRGAGGTESLNSVCQRELTRHKTALEVWNGTANCHEHSGLHQGDTILCTRNLWHRGLQNGSLGTIVEVEREPVEILDAEGRGAGYALAWVLWDDGVRRPLQEDMLDDIELGYAITVHKAQGSQWPCVIVPVLRNRLLDRTLLYTAITRAQSQVILVGDEEAARAAAIQAPRARLRLVGLDGRLRSAIENGVVAGPITPVGRR
jgi:exodeoxyribonuclease V alpha subunit